MNYTITRTEICDAIDLGSKKDVSGLGCKIDDMKSTIASGGSVCITGEDGTIVTRGISSMTDLDAYIKKIWEGKEKYGK